MADGYCRDPRKYASRNNNANSAPTKIIVNKKFIENPGLWSENNTTMYTNPNQYSGQGYQTAYPQYQQNYTGYGYENYNQPAQYIQQPGVQQPVPPGEEYPQNNWAPVQQQQQQQQQQQLQSTQQHGYTSSQTSSKGEDDGVAKERKAQNAQLIKQREEYVRKARVLRRELDLLRNQKHEIMSEKSPQRDMEPIVKENIKLQEEIQSKMKAIHNVIEMLSSIIKDGRKISDLEAQLDESPSSLKTHHHHNNKSQKSDSSSEVKYNYIHYDPELHWCRMCEEFPKTAKDFLLHLQSDKHRSNIQENDVGDNTPWHKLAPEAELPCYENGQKKRIPIRGLQFFISAPAWYCKLCDTWIGDLHCASHHLKSQAHFQNYANFVEQNPHWEIEWLKDREKSLARSDRHHETSDSDSDKRKSSKKHRKQKMTESSGKDKKKKKRSKKRRKHSTSDTSSSSSSSDSSSDDDEPNDKSKSIRVVMRNMKVQSIMNEDLSGKWEMLERLVDEHKKKEDVDKHQTHRAKDQEDPMINQWMTVSEPPQDKNMLDTLKDRMKVKQDQERAKYAELEKRQKEREREERETKERKAREEADMRDKADRDRKERERLEYERIRDKERNAVRFKTRDRENYRKRRTPSRSPDRSHQRNGRSSQSRRSRSRSEEKKKPPPPPPPSSSGKRLPFIGRMPLFKNKKVDDKHEKEIKKEDYDIPRVTRFQPGNLARAFLPSPDVVCFPKLSSFPPISAPPPPPVVSEPPPPPQPDPPAPPKISEEKVPKAPPPPKINAKDVQQQQEPAKNAADEGVYDEQTMFSNYYPPGPEFGMMFYDYNQEMPAPPPPPDHHSEPLQPPPLPPNDPIDELAMLGISADDMAVSTFQ